MSSRDPGPIPNRWLNCPRKAGSLLANKFLAFKTPLGADFNDKVPEANRFTPSMLFMAMKSYKVKLGLWVDLTNTSRFYNKSEVDKMECLYYKLQCRGHGETPSEEQTKEFILKVRQYTSKFPLDIVGVHCTHGFNRTGFLLVAYLVEEMDWGVEAAIREFAKVRPPGIYKQDYLVELYRRYDDVEYTPAAPSLPDWCLEEPEQEDDEPESQSNRKPEENGRNSKRRRKEVTHKKEFIPGIGGVEPFNDQPKLLQIQKKVQDMCGWESSGFPGAQPVSMDTHNIRLLTEKPYRVSWKADGSRYMMLIESEGNVFLFDRDFCAFKVYGLRFLHKKDLRRHLTDTLLDGEMVVDKVEGKEIPRYLVYDVVKFEGQDVGKASFYPNRLRCIENEIVGPRIKATSQGIIDRSREPFSVRLKQFWELPMAHQLLGEKFAKTLSHEPDGLIFQPSIEPYKGGRCDDILKWKPINMNSVDFKLKLTVESGQGIVPRKIGHLYVGGLDRPFAMIKYKKTMKEQDNKIIECKFEGNEWVFMRERTDKSYPNAFNTAQAVVESIKDPVTKEMLLFLIDHERFHDDTDVMPPPKRVRR